MGKAGRVQVEGTPSKQRKSKRLRLANIAHNFNDNDREKISVDELDVVETLQELNCDARRSETPPIIPSTSAARPNSSNPNDSAPEEHVQSEKRKTRGKTMMKAFSMTPNERAIVEFNEFGQPIGRNSKYLSSYLGTIAREMVPVNISSWNNVDSKLKNDLWTYIQTRFIVDAHYKSLLIKMLGQRWKESKSRLISAIRDASKSPDASSRLEMLKPDNIKNDQDWIDFTKEKLSEEFELTSKKFKEIRSKNNLPHTMSRKGYARLAEELKKEHASNIDRDTLWCKAHVRKNGEPPNSVVGECITKIKEHSNTKSSQGTVSLGEDGVGMLFGKERYGRIRGLGFGVTPTQFGVHTTNSKKVSALENEVAGLKDELQELKDMFMASMKGKGNQEADPLIPLAATPQSHSQSHHGSTCFPNNGAQLPKKCKLLNWQKKIVAEGTLASTDPMALVHHVPLGVDNWKVWVDVAVEPKATLWRETAEASTIEQAVGTTVAWPKDFIVAN